VGKRGKGPLLPGAPERRGFDDPVFEAVEESGPVLPDPFQDVFGQGAIVGARFDDLVARRTP